MFRGINLVVLDAKGRIKLPVRYRQLLPTDKESQFVLTIDTESPCLLLYPIQEWEIIEEKLQALPSFNPAVRRIQRLLIGHATDLDLDGKDRKSTRLNSSHTVIYTLSLHDALPICVIDSCYLQIKNLSSY